MSGDFSFGFGNSEKTGMSSREFKGLCFTTSEICGRRNLGLEFSLSDVDSNFDLTYRAIRGGD